MKIKKAIKKAVKYNHKWIAVDIQNEIYSYSKKPKFYKCGFWANDKADEQFIGIYTGKKKSSSSLKKLKM
ncbi:MAG: hypothetical protein KZQ74_04560 [gamma proteobacterium symbiont of Bathyaustriella thionipta]|nr:hypothetical protein [gamma proteobacterium symbiont of Bathyaustriella thionipta]MCU7958330.1 hypothetical protein [gamma proteobacterium symbiont of Bathyaustriella thionipta]MCU7966459.1 hypothetical protein [gamma proteobacterium symbiont of Bathyaustriella thionipta]